MLTEVQSFDDANKNDINICFTTIQQLHYDMRIGNERENALNEENFKNQKVVYLSDEAHHMSAETRTLSQLELLESESWEKQWSVFLNPTKTTCCWNSLPRMITRCLRWRKNIGTKLLPV